MSHQGSSRRGFLKNAVMGTAAGAAGWPVAAKSEGTDKMTCGSNWERPPKQSGNDLNLIVIVSDTFRADNLTCYGPKWLDSLETPNLDRFSEKATVFMDAYAEGMPTITIRRSLYTGRRVVPCYYFVQPDIQLPGWHPLYHEDVTLSETLAEAGYINTLISSLYHQFKPGRNFHRGFHTWRWIRGLEGDKYGTSPHELMNVSDIVPEEFMAQHPELNLQFYMSQVEANRNLWRQEGESVSQITAQTAIRWLNENHSQRPFYLHVEFFDPHEPWDPPRRFLEKYMPNASGPSYIQPIYETIPLPDSIKDRFRANYAGAVSCVDFWVGNLFDAIEQFGLFDNSVVVFMADHGAMLGEHGQFCKGPDKLRSQVTHVPIMIRTPGNSYAGKKIDGLVEIPDVMPTLLGRLDLKSPSRVTGIDLWPLAAGDTRAMREYVVQAYGWVASVRNREWSCSEIWKPEARQAAFHKFPGEAAEIYRPQLYNLQTDPKELTDVADKYHDVATQMSAKLKEYIASGENLTFGSFNSGPSLDTEGNPHFK